MELQRTPLNAAHRALGAKMVDFGGWDMPVQYRSILGEHEAVRTRAGLFDVSHMGVIEVTGAAALAALQYLVPNDLARLQPEQGLYTQFCNPDGGTRDDLLVFCLNPEQWWLVVNAGNRASDLDWVQTQLAAFEVVVTPLYAELGLLALQGPLAATILAELAPAAVLDPERFPAFALQRAEVGGIGLHVSRSGYTGEDGFELYVPVAALESLWNQLLAAGAPHGLEPVGLGARDTLRLEAAMPLYGHELETHISPLEAGLAWSVKLKKEADFIGKTALQQQREQGLARRRIGFTMPDSRRAPRQGYGLYLGEERVGEVTSGSLSPTLGYPIGMAYVERPWADDLDTLADLTVDVRGQRLPVTRVKLPFYRRTP
ncbi:MAG: glycine cleavage system aminomethyltransferase GcvT [Candidatus Sericytochromatia bacterium]